MPKDRVERPAADDLDVMPDHEGRRREPIHTRAGPKANRPLWDRQEAILRSRGSTPRDFFEHDIFQVDAPEEVKRNIRFVWLSDIILRGRAILPGFRMDMYAPVTPDVMEELNLKVRTLDRTAEGIPRAGHDAVLYYVPETIAKEMDDYWKRQANLRSLPAQQKARLQSGLAESQQTRTIGDLEIVERESDLEEAEQRQRSELGTPFDQTAG